MSTYQQWEEVPACPGCGTPDPAPAWEPDIRQCRACGLYLRSPRPIVSELMRFYDEGGNYSGWEQEESVRRRLWHKRLRLIERHAPRGRLLDVGTGDGHFPALCRESGWAAECVESSKAGRALCLKRGIRPLAEDIGAAGAGHFDVVTLWHVLEHLPDAARMLRECRRMLRPDGLLAVAVPNESLTLSRGASTGHPFGPLLWGYETHIIYFESSSLERVLQAAGFHVTAWAVDDVETRPTLRTRLRHRFHQAALALGGRHLGQAMTLLARPQLSS